MKFQRMDTSKEFFLQLIANHKGIIKSLCTVYYSKAEDQQDIRQDIILQLWKSLPTFRGESTTSTWVYRVSLNTILSKVRKEQRQPLKESIDSTHENVLTTSYQYDDDLQVLKQLIQSLKAIDKAVIILYLEGYKNKEIAELIQLSSSNVSTRLNRIKTQLKSKFKIYHSELR